MVLHRATFAVLLLSPVFSGGTAPAKEHFITHEWGTFTSVAGNDGQAVEWAPLSGAPDLPCFVARLQPGNIKLSMAFVRMETPVLYFYPQRAMTLSVHVAFPKGWITEWYPQANRIQPEPMIPTIGISQGQIAWDSIQLLPGEKLDFPVSKGASHYFAARETDSAPIRVNHQQEKLIFYRGIGNFSIPLRPKFNSEGRVEIRNAGSEPVALAILFENRDGKMGYRLTRGIKDSVTLDTPELTANLDSLRQKLVEELVEFGLYRKEAQAMLETWKDSWFEEGMRVFYIVPRPMVDSELPLKITPEPASVARVFVGRIEVLSPWMRQTIASALAQKDAAALTKFGRFLYPFAQMTRSPNGPPMPAFSVIQPGQRNACIP